MWSPHAHSAATGAIDDATLEQLEAQIAALKAQGRELLNAGRGSEARALMGQVKVLKQQALSLQQEAQRQQVEAPREPTAPPQPRQPSPGTASVAAVQAASAVKPDDVASSSRPEPSPSLKSAQPAASQSKVERIKAEIEGVKQRGSQLVNEGRTGEARALVPRMRQLREELARCEAEEQSLKEAAAQRQRDQQKAEESAIDAIMNDPLLLSISGDTDVSIAPARSHEVVVVVA